jgi:hypothetical protein
MLKNFFEFSKKVRIFYFRWWRSYLIFKKSHLYLKINGILSSLKWYITCEMVTRGYFLINVLKMEILKIHPVYLKGCLGNPNKKPVNPNKKFYYFFVWVSGDFCLDFRDFCLDFQFALFKKSLSSSLRSLRENGNFSRVLKALNSCQ